MNTDSIMLGSSDVQTPHLGIGTWQWGDSVMWGYGKGGYDDNDIRQAFEAALRAGVNLFDTAEVYGLGRSETLIGQFIRERRKEVVIATKFFPFPWRLTQAQFFAALRRSLKRLGVAQVDLYQIHWAFPPIPVEKWADALAQAVKEGLTRAVGVSNYSTAQMGRAYNVLAERGVPLASNQVEYSLLHRDPERNGVLQACRDLGVTLIAYSPLRKGMLTGKYTPDNIPPGIRAQKYNAEYLRKIQPLLGLMQEIGQAHGGKTAAQVALNWTICKGALPIPGAKNIRQTESNLGALGWRMNADEVMALDQASAEL